LTIHVIGLRRTGLAEILTLGWQWAWSVTAVLSVEVLAAGAMIANAVTVEPMIGPGTSSGLRRCFLCLEAFQASEWRLCDWGTRGLLPCRPLVA
jgi:hypothetical protein